jgi:hypothetical protein
MSEPPQIAPGAKSLDAPNDPDIAFLFALWQKKCGKRTMPSRADFDPAEFRRLLPYIFLIDVEADDGAFRTRLVGDEIVRFLGHTPPKGKSPMASFTPEGWGGFRIILEHVVKSRTPIFRAGRAYWSIERSYKKFEACVLPLSTDDTAVNMIIGAVKFANK